MSNAFDSKSEENTQADKDVSTFGDIISMNRRKKEKLSEERNRSNANVLSSYRMGTKPGSGGARSGQRSAQGSTARHNDKAVAGNKVNIPGVVIMWKDATARRKEDVTGGGEATSAVSEEQPNKG